MSGVQVKHRGTIDEPLRFLLICCRLFGPLSVRMESGRVSKGHPYTGFLKGTPGKISAQCTGVGVPFRNPSAPHTPFK